MCRTPSSSLAAFIGSLSAVVASAGSCHERRLLEVGGQRLSARFGHDGAADLPAQDHRAGRHRRRRGRRVRPVRASGSGTRCRPLPSLLPRSALLETVVLPESRNSLTGDMTQPGGGATEPAADASGQGMRRQLGPIVVGIVAVLGLVVGGGLLVNGSAPTGAPRRASRHRRLQWATPMRWCSRPRSMATGREPDPARRRRFGTRVDGVAAAQGAARRFVQVYPGEGASGTASNEASVRSAIALSAEGVFARTCKTGASRPTRARSR